MWFIVWWEKKPNKRKKGERKKSKGMKKEIASILTWELTFIRKGSHLQATRCFSISVEMRLVFLWLPENKVNNVYDSLDAWVSRVVEMSMNKISIGWEKALLCLFFSYSCCENFMISPERLLMTCVAENLS